MKIVDIQYECLNLNRYKMGNSLRQVSKMLLERGLDISYEGIRKWINNFSPLLVKKLKKIRLKSSKKTWFVDEMFLKVDGIKCYLYRCIDTSGNLVGYHLSYRRNTKSSIALFKKCLKISKSNPSNIVTDGHICHALAIKELFPEVKHIVVKPSMNYIEQNNRWMRQRMRATIGFKSFACCETLCAIFEEMKDFFRPQKYKNQFISENRKRKIFISRYYFLLDMFENTWVPGS